MQTILLQHRLKVNWLSKRSMFLRSKSVNFLDFRARKILGWCFLSISITSWKWLEPSTVDNKESLLSSSLHFCSASINFLSCRLSFSNYFIILEKDLMGTYCPHHHLCLSCRTQWSLIELQGWTHFTLPPSITSFTFYQCLLSCHPDHQWQRQSPVQGWLVYPN